MDFYTNIDAINKIKINISNKEQKQIFSKIINLFNKLNSSTDDDGEAGSKALLMAIDICFSSNKEKLSFLKSLLYICKNSTLKKALSRMIASVENEIKKEEIKTSSGYEQKIIQESTQSNTNNIEEFIRFRKIEITLFNLNKNINKYYFPTQDPKVNTKQFDNLSDNELIEMFSKDNFYKLNEKQIHALLQTVSDRYLSANNVSPCAIVLDNLTLNDNSVCYGQYSPNKGNISINKKLLRNLEDAENIGDQYLPYQLLSTVIHEARHRVQFSNLGKTNLSLKDQYVSLSLAHNQDLLSYSQYLAEPDELDARNASLEFLKNAAKSSVKNSSSLIEFYNHKLKNEHNNNKSEISDTAKAFFEEIYYSTPIKSKNPKSINPQMFSDLIHGKINTVGKEPHL